MTAASAVETTPAPTPGNTCHHDRPTAAFHCSTDWHLIRLGKYAAPIHALMLRVQDDDFIGSVEQIAEYFGADDRAIRRTLHKLIKSEFVLEIAPRFGQSTVYRALTHKEWAETHPGECAVKRTAGQGIIKFDANPSPPRGGVEPSPSPSHPEPLPPKGRGPLPMKGRQVSEESPKKETDTPTQQAASVSAPSKSSKPRKAKSKQSPLEAAQEAFQYFRQMYNDEQALQMVLWVLYRAASSGQIPHHVNYYITSRNGFERKYGCNSETVLAERAVEAFNQNAADFLAGRCPELVRWLQDCAETIPGMEIPALAVGDDDIPF